MEQKWKYSSAQLGPELDNIDLNIELNIEPNIEPNIKPNIEPKKTTPLVLVKVSIGKSS